MRKLSVILAGVTVVVWSAAAWPQVGTWTSLTNITAHSGLVSDGTDLYRVETSGANGNIYRYDGPVLDTWTQLTSAAFPIFDMGSPGEGDRACALGGKIITKRGESGTTLNIYDITTDSWSQTTAALVDPVNNYLGWAQGIAYTHAGSAGQVWVTWTELDAASNVAVAYACAVYDVGTGTWGASYDFQAATGAPPKWTRMAAVAVGDYVLAQTDNTNYMGQAEAGRVGVDVYDLSTQPADFSGVWTYQYHDLSSGKMTNNVGSCFGTEAMAVDSGTGLVYITAVDISPMRFVSYDPATNTWTELADGAGGGGYRTHDNGDLAGGWIYSRQGSSFEGYQVVPEPGVIALAGLGILGLLARRRK